MKILRIVLISIFIILLCAICIFAQAPDTLWTKTFGGANTDWGYSVQQTFDGGYIIVGETHSFGPGDADVWLLKTDENGDTVWTKTYGGYTTDIGYSVQQTADSGYIISGKTRSFGAGDSDVYLIKTDASGDTLWTRTYGGTLGDEGNSVQQTLDGGYIIAGGTNSYGAGGDDVYLIKTDTNGDTLWTKTFGGDSADAGRSVQQTFDGGFIIAGYTESYGAGGYDAYLIKTDSLGNTLWTRTYGGTLGDMGFSGQQTSDSGYIIAGGTDSYGASCGYLVKTHVSGDTLWTNTYREQGIWDGLFSVDQTSDNGYIATGFSYSPGASGLDVWLLRTNVNGDTLWMSTYGGDSIDAGSSVQQTFDGGYIVAGYTNSFGAGDFDVYLIKTEPDVGIEEKPEQQNKSTDIIFACSPNPFTTMTRIELLGMSRGCKYNLTIYDASGRLVKSIELKTSTYELGTDLVPGVYFLKVTIGEHKEIQKLIKIR